MNHQLKNNPLTNLSRKERSPKWNKKDKNNNKDSKIKKCSKLISKTRKLDKSTQKTGKIATESFRKFQITCESLSNSFYYLFNRKTCNKLLLIFDGITFAIFNSQLNLRYSFNLFSWLKLEFFTPEMIFMTTIQVCVTDFMVAG